MGESTVLVLNLVGAALGYGVVVGIMKGDRKVAMKWATGGFIAYYLVGYAAAQILLANGWHWSLPPLVLVGLTAAAIVGLIGRTVTAMAPDRTEAPSESPPPQLIGLACTVCSAKIMIAADATWCATCQRAVHRACSHTH
jgi:hypothetical protein